MVIALCGRSGSGKSAVSAALKDRGAYVIDADKIGREIMCGDVLEKIKKRFPDCFSNGELLRRRLAERVFSDENELKALNGITHPEIKRKIVNEISVKSKDFDIITVDAALLIEAGMANLADFTVSVVAPDELRKERIMLRDGISEKEAELRISAQNPDDFYISATDYCVNNDGSVPVSRLADDILERSRAFAKSKDGI